MERNSFERIIGGTAQQREKTQLETKLASLKSGSELFGDYLIERTQEEQENIIHAVEYANSIAQQYGSTIQFDADRVFLLKPNGVEEYTGGKHIQGMCNALEQTIAVDRRDSNALVALSVVHEVLHLDSYHSAQIIEDPGVSEGFEDIPYRSGISMLGRDGKTNYFGIAEEAIIATLSQNFFEEKIKKNPEYTDEIERTERIKEWLRSLGLNRITDKERRLIFDEMIDNILIFPENEKVYHVLQDASKSDNYKLSFVRDYYQENLESGNIFHERIQERRKFNDVLDNIISSSGGKISDRSELFEHFARAHFTGNYLPLARIIDQALGDGAFRKIAEELGTNK